MEDHRSQDRRQKKKKKVEIYTNRTATGFAIENAVTRFVITATDSAIENVAPRLVITTTGSAIENAEAGSTGELKCRIVVSDRRTHRQPKLI
jgi:S-adenosylmethionine synthetase